MKIIKITRILVNALFLLVLNLFSTAHAEMKATLPVTDCTALQNEQDSGGWFAKFNKQGQLSIQQVESAQTDNFKNNPDWLAIQAISTTTTNSNNSIECNEENIAIAFQDDVILTNNGGKSTTKKTVIINDITFNQNKFTDEKNNIEFNVAQGEKNITITATPIQKNDNSTFANLMKIGLSVFFILTALLIGYFLFTKFLITEESSDSDENESLSGEKLVNVLKTRLSNNGDYEFKVQKDDSIVIESLKIKDIQDLLTPLNFLDLDTYNNVKSLVSEYKELINFKDTPVDNPPSEQGSSDNNHNSEIMTKLIDIKTLVDETNQRVAERFPVDSKKSNVLNEKEKEIKQLNDSLEEKKNEIKDLNNEINKYSNSNTRTLDDVKKHEFCYNRVKAYLQTIKNQLTTVPSEEEISEESLTKHFNAFYQSVLFGTPTEDDYLEICFYIKLRMLLKEEMSAIPFLSIDDKKYDLSKKVDNLMLLDYNQDDSLLHILTLCAIHLQSHSDKIRFKDGINKILKGTNNIDNLYTEFEHKTMIYDIKSIPTIENNALNKGYSDAV